MREDPVLTNSRNEFFDIKPKQNEVNYRLIAILFENKQCFCVDQQT